MTCSSEPPHDYHQVSYDVDFPWDGYEADHEEITPNSGGGRKAWKPFQHWYARQLPSSPLGTGINLLRWGISPHVHRGIFRNPVAGYRQFTWGTMVEKYGSVGRLDNGLPPFYTKLADGSFVHPPAELDSLLQHALRVMLPSIKAELPLLNSVYELKDFKSLPGLLKRSQGLIKAITKGKTLLSLGNKTLREVSRQSASWYLQQQFNIMPLLSDIIGIYRVLSRTEARLNDFITRAGKRQVHHFQWIIPEYTDSYDPPESTGYPPHPYALDSLDSYGCDRKVTYKPSKFHAEIEYNYNFTQYQIEHARLLYYLDSLGVNYNPAIIWNAVKWSFLVDWVVGIGRYLDSLKRANMEPLINIHRFLWSIKRERTIRVTKGMLLPLSEYTMNRSWDALPEIREVAYRRDISPCPRSWIESSGLSPKEFSLGAAIVISNGRRRRR